MGYQVDQEVDQEVQINVLRGACFASIIKAMFC